MYVVDTSKRTKSTKWSEREPVKPSSKLLLEPDFHRSCMKSKVKKILCLDKVVCY